MIAAFVGGRSDFGIIQPLITLLGGEYVSGAFLTEDTDIGIALSAAATMERVAYAIEYTDPECIIVVGDRFEALAAAQAAYHMEVPIVHLHGGETTLGSRDNAHRHAITQLADLHLTATDEAALNVLMMKPDADVYAVGAIGAYNALMAKPLPAPEVVVSVPADPEVAEAVESALGEIEHIRIGPNADTGRSQMRGITLPPDEFLGTMKGAKVIIGNSSCGIIEAPSAGTWTINVGDRQAGRERCESIIDVPVDVDAISAALSRALTEPFPECVNPYEHGDSARKAADIIDAWL